MVQVSEYKQVAEKIRSDPERAGRADAARTEAFREIVEYSLAELRRFRRLTQAEMAKKLQISQPNVSRMERREARVELQTLRNFIEALGGRLRISAVFDDEEVPLAVTVQQPTRDA